MNHPLWRGIIASLCITIIVAFTVVLLLIAIKGPS